MTLSIISRVLIFALSLCTLGLGQEAKQGDFSYENHNQTDYGPLDTNRIRGLALDTQDVPVPEALVILFTEKGHKTVKHTTTNDNGRFAITAVSAGRYRLVVKYNGFCSANIPIRITKGGKSKREIFVRMKPASLDECSYGELR